MDPITHGLTGMALSLLSHPVRNGRLQPEAGEDAAAAGTGAAADRGAKATFWAAVAGSVLPDIDFVFRAGGELAYFKYHRGPTHSLPGVLILSVLLTLVLSRIFPEARKKMLFLWSFLAMLVHVLMDILTVYSTQALWPFSAKPLSLDLVNIVDPVILAVLAGGLLLGRFKGFRQTGKQLAVGVFIVLALYVGLRGYLQWELKNCVGEYFIRHSIEAVAVTPQLIGVGSWNFIVKTPEKFIIGRVEYPEKTVEIRKSFDRKASPQITQKAISTEVGGVLNSFTDFLLVTGDFRDGRYYVKLSDLQFGFEQFMPSAEVVLNRELEVVKQGLLPFHGRNKS